LSEEDKDLTPLDRALGAFFILVWSLHLKMA